MEAFQMPSVIECNIETLTDRYGQFIAQPLERGWGITLGNALRRVLLSSIEGHAITAVRIAGCLHEFTSLSGVTEDVTDVILNLKEIQFIDHSDEESKVLRVNVQGPCPVKASDIQHDGNVRILNPEAPIATLNEDGALSMDLILKRGRGYVPADVNSTDDPTFIPIDSVHSPVRKVNYEVNETRVGSATDYEKLTIEVWTNGAITPQQAVAEAASRLNSHLGLFAELTGPEAAVAPAAKGKRSKASSDLDALLNRALSEYEFTEKVAKGFEALAIDSVRDLVRLTDKDLAKGKKFGQKALKEVNDFLESLNLTLGMDV
jgi:DNA-directed RNA polymerase subunit alpha